MRKKTRSILSGLMIAVASLVALGYAYEEARVNMLRFFMGTLLMVLVILICAALVVAVLALVRKLLKRMRGTPDADIDDVDNTPPA